MTSQNLSQNETENKKNSMIFYRSFYESIKKFSKSIQNELYSKIFEFAFNQVEIKVSEKAEAIFLLVKEQLIANQRKYENGKKAKQKQMISKKKANDKQTISKPTSNVECRMYNVNVECNNVNVNENEKPALSQKNDFDFNGFTENEINAIKNWLEHNKQKTKKSYTEMGLKTLRTKMLSLKTKNLLIPSINNCIANNYTGLFELKHNNYKQKKETEKFIFCPQHTSDSIDSILEAKGLKAFSTEWYQEYNKLAIERGEEHFDEIPL